MNKSYHIDTNVLLDNESAIEILRNGCENEINISMNVLQELDGLLKNTEKRPMAMKAVEKIYDNKEIINFTGDKDQIFNTDDEILHTVVDKPNDPVLVTNDKMLQLKSYIQGIDSQEFKGSIPFQSDSQKYTGFIDYDGEEQEWILNNFYFKEGKLFQYKNYAEKCIDYEMSPWKIKPWDIYQRAATELLMDTETLVSTIQSRAGSGKSYLALASAFTQVFEKKNYEKVVIVKYPIEIGERMGFLPGSIQEKMQPHWNSVYKLMLKLHEKRNLPKKALLGDSKENADLLPEFNPKYIEFMPVQHLRGDNIENSYVVVSEGQNVPRNVMKTLLTRMGENTKVVIEGDTSQVDHPQCNQQNNGLNWVVRSLMGRKEYGHLALNSKKSRGPICSMVLDSEL